MSDERLVDIETKLAHQEQLLLELNDVITDQQARIMQLEEQYRVLAERLRSLGEAVPGGDSGPERPPHY